MLSHIQQHMTLPNLDHFCTHYMPEKLQNSYIIYMYGIVLEHDKVISTFMIQKDTANNAIDDVK